MVALHSCTSRCSANCMSICRGAKVHNIFERANAHVNLLHFATTDHRSQITDHRPQITDYQPTNHPSPNIHHSLPFTLHPSLLSSHPSLPTPHPSLFTPHPSLLTPHSSPLTPHPSPLTRQGQSSTVTYTAIPSSLPTNPIRSPVVALMDTHSSATSSI